MPRLTWSRSLQLFRDILLRALMLQNLWSSYCTRSTRQWFTARCSLSTVASLLAEIYIELVPVFTHSSDSPKHLAAQTEREDVTLVHKNLHETLKHNASDECTRSQYQYRLTTNVASTHF